MLTASLVACGLAALAYLLFVALTMRSAYPLHGDETFFATCVARGLETERWLMPGCHDNKGPMIYVVYRLVVALGGEVYGPASAKLAAAALLLAAVGMLAAATARAFGAVVAAAGVLVCLLTTGANPQTLVLNADLVGTVFASAACLISLARGPTTSRGFAAGLMVGLAMMTKQSFVLFLLPVWLASWIDGTAAGVRWGRRLGYVLASVSGAAIPLVGFAAWFAWVGELDAFLTSVFLYPMIYGLAAEGSFARQMAYRALNLAAIVDGAGILCLGFAAALAIGARRSAKLVGAEMRATSVLLAFGLAALAIMVTAPVVALRTATAFFVVGSFAAGLAGCVLFGGAGSSREGLWRTYAAVLGVLVLTAALNVWGRNGPVRPGDVGFKVDRVPEAQGRVGYVYAIWPQFYYFNGLRPASDVMYATAFDGRVIASMEKRGPRAAWLDRWLSTARQRNALRLRSDFERTPPEFIVVGDSLPLAAGQWPRSGVAALDQYLDQKCRFVRALTPPTLETARYEAMGLYRCSPA